MWWQTPITATFERLKQLDCQFGTSSGYTVRPCLKKTNLFFVMWISNESSIFYLKDHCISQSSPGNHCEPWLIWTWGNWLMWLWKLTNTKIIRVNWQAEDPQELIVQSQFEFKGMRKTSVTIWKQPSGNPLLQAGGTPLRDTQITLFVLFRPSTDWTRPNHIRKSNLLYSLY